MRDSTTKYRYTASDLAEATHLWEPEYAHVPIERRRVIAKRFARVKNGMYVLFIGGQEIGNVHAWETQRAELYLTVYLKRDGADTTREVIEHFKAHDFDEFLRHNLRAKCPVCLRLFLHIDKRTKVSVAWPVAGQTVCYRCARVAHKATKRGDGDLEDLAQAAALLNHARKLRVVA